MEILMIIVGILAIVGMIAFLVHLFIKAYNQDQKEQDERMLVLEKRINDIKKEINNNIEWEKQLRKDFERQVNEEILRLKRQLNKKSDKNEL